MRHARASTDNASQHRSAARATAIACEDVPPFSNAPNERQYRIGENHASGPLSLAVSGQFQETVAGLATHAVLEPDVFDHFFGALANA